MIEEHHVPITIFGVELGDNVREMIAGSAYDMALHYNQGVFSLVTTLSTISGPTHDEIYARANFDGYDRQERIEAAASSLAWLHTFRPYEHEKREFVCDTSRMMALIETDPESLYGYSTLVYKAPKERFFTILSKLSPQKADDYLTHCALYITLNPDSAHPYAAFPGRMNGHAKN